MASIRTIKTVFTGESVGVVAAAGEGKKAVASFATGVEKAGKLASTAALAAGAAIAGAIGAGIQSILSGGKASALLAAQLGADAVGAARLGEISGKVYAKGIVDSVDEANDAIRASVQNGLINNRMPTDVAGAIASQVVTLTKTLGEDAGRITAAVSTMLKTGLIKNAQEGFDILQRGAELGVNKQQDLLDTLTEYPTVFRDLGLSAKSALGILSQGLRGGARDSDKVADALKEFNIRARDGSKLTAQGFDMLGLSAKKMADEIAAGGPRASAALDLTIDRLVNIKDPVERSAAAVALFGTQAEDLGQALFHLDPSTATENVGELEGAVKKAGQTLEDTATTKIEKFKRAVQAGIVVKLGEAVGWVEKNQTAAKSLGVVLAGVTAAVLVIGAAYKTYQAIVIVMTAVQWLWNAALTANPIGIVIVAIGLLVAGIYLLWQNSSTFRDFFIDMWDRIKKGVEVSVNWITDTAWPAIQRAFTWIKDTARGVKDDVVGFFDAIGNGISGAFSVAVSFAKDQINNLITFVNRGINGMNRLVRAANLIPGVNLPQIPNIPALAKGGPTVPGRTYLVGENGPELWNSRGRGTMLSNKDSFGGNDSGTPDVLHLEIPIQIGDEVVRTVDLRIDLRDRKRKRRVLAGAGGAR